MKDQVAVEGPEATGEYRLLEANPPRPDGSQLPVTEKPDSALLSRIREVFALSVTRPIAGSSSLSKTRLLR